MGLVITASFSELDVLAVAAHSDCAAVAICSTGSCCSVRVWATDRQVLDTIASAVRQLATCH
jgi:hypothetical protein